MKPGLLWWLGIGAVAATLGLSGFWLPAPVPADASPTLFSAIRALRHVKAIAAAPHPTGSAENRPELSFHLAGAVRNGRAADILQPRAQHTPEITCRDSVDGDARRAASGACNPPDAPGDHHRNCAGLRSPDVLRRVFDAADSETGRLDKRRTAQERLIIRSYPARS